MRASITLENFLTCSSSCYLRLPDVIRAHISFMEWPHMDASDRFEWLIMQYNHFDLLASFSELAHLDKNCWGMKTGCERHQYVEKTLEEWLEKSHYDFLDTALNPPKITLEKPQAAGLKNELKRLQDYDFFEAHKKRNFKKIRRSPQPVYT